MDRLEGPRIRAAQRVDGRGARRVAGRAEPVGDGHQAGAGVAGVLVLLANAADVGSGGVADGERGPGRRRSHGHGRRDAGGLDWLRHGGRSLGEVGDEELSKPLTFGEIRFGRPEEGRHGRGGLSRR